MQHSQMFKKQLANPVRIVIEKLCPTLYTTTIQKDCNIIELSLLIRFLSNFGCECYLVKQTYKIIFMWFSQLELGEHVN